MTLLRLVLVSVFLAFGLALLPPLTGVGLGSLVTRSWLILGGLVFAGHYLHYLREGTRAYSRKPSTRTKAHRRFAPVGERSAEYR
jgi:hypothetical protein